MKNARGQMFRMKPSNPPEKRRKSVSSCCIPPGSSLTTIWFLFFQVLILLFKCVYTCEREEAEGKSQRLCI